jgi:hypothetical protein
LSPLWLVVDIGELILNLAKYNPRRAGMARLVCFANDFKSRNYE